MLMNSLRKLTLVWMIAWLPFSGAIAAVMPISGMPGGAVASLHAEMATDADSVDASVTGGISSLPCHNTAAISDTNPSGLCEHCLLCHLAVSLMLPSIQNLPGLTPSNSFALATPSQHTSFFPEPASPPPRTLHS